MAAQSYWTYCLHCNLTTSSGSCKKCCNSGASGEDAGLVLRQVLVCAGPQCQKDIQWEHQVVSIATSQWWGFSGAREETRRGRTGRREGSPRGGLELGGGPGWFAAASLAPWHIAAAAILAQLFLWAPGKVRIGPKVGTVCIWCRGVKPVG